MLMASVFETTRVSPAKMCFVGMSFGSRTKNWLTYQASPALVCFFRRSPCVVVPELRERAAVARHLLEPVLLVPDLRARLVP